MAETTYQLEPKEFESIFIDHYTAQGQGRTRSQRGHPLCPPYPKDYIQTGVWIALPQKVRIETDDLNSIVWGKINMPICLTCFLTSEEMFKIYDHYVYIKNIETGEEFSFWADLQRYDREPPSPPPAYPEGQTTGERRIYDIGYFTDLPLYSATYNVWVRIGDVQSEPQSLTIEIMENGKRVERPE